MVKTFFFALFMIFLLTTCSCSSTTSYPFPVSTQSTASVHSISTPSLLKTTTPLNLLPTPSQMLLSSAMPLTDIIGEILKSPDQYTGKQVEIIGSFHGWDLLDEMQGGPPVSRSDWVIVDNSGAIYVTGLTPSNLKPSSHVDTGAILRLGATVQSSQTGLVYLEAKNVEILRLWNIEFTLSGGLRGLQRVVELVNTGQMIVIDQKMKKQVTVQVLEEDVVKMSGFIAEVVQLPSLDQLLPCTDCYQYNLNIQMGAQYFSFLLNDINKNDSGLAPLVNALMDLQERALSGQLK